MSSPSDRPGPLTVYVDVTDTIATRWRAGIQRVVVQLIDGLAEDERLDVVPVVWLESARSWRRLTPQESARLDPGSPPAPGAEASGASGGSTAFARAVRQVRPLVGRLRRSLVGMLSAAGVEPALRRVRRRVLALTRDRALVPLTCELPRGAVLLELDTVWNNTWVDRDELYVELLDRGVHVAAMVYDLLPQTHPEWFETSLVAVSNRTIEAQLRRSEVLFAISEHTAGELASWAGRRDLDHVDVVLVPLGADGADAAPEATPPPELEDAAFVLTVGTIEPRKNHAVLLDAFERWIEQHPELHLVVVGRPGWNDGDIVARLERMLADPRTGPRLHWRRSAGDEELGALYGSALVVAVPSVAEGFGLPVIEALGHGTPVVASSGGALPEAGRGIIDLVDAHDRDGWVDALTRHVVDPGRHAQLRREAASFEPPRWFDTAQVVADTLVSSFPTPTD